MLRTQSGSFNNHNPEYRCVICTGVTLFALVLQLNCTALSQSESSNFFMYIIMIVTGTVAGGVTLNPAVLGSISGAGLILKTYSEVKNYKRKIEMCKFAYTTYEKVLTHLRSFMRGLEYNEKEFLDHVKVLDEIIIEMCPLTDKFEKKYNKVFI